MLVRSQVGDDMMTQRRSDSISGEDCNVIMSWINLVSVGGSFSDPGHSPDFVLTITHRPKVIYSLGFAKGEDGFKIDFNLRENGCMVHRATCELTLHRLVVSCAPTRRRLDIIFKGGDCSCIMR